MSDPTPLTPNDRAAFITEVMLQRRGLGPNATEAEIKQAFLAEWNSDLLLTLIAEHTQGHIRDVLLKRIKSLDPERRAMRFFIFIFGFMFVFMLIVALIELFSD